MTDTLSLTGIVGTDPKQMRTGAGLTICSFRLASAQRRYDRVTGEWRDIDTNWYTVTAFRHLAENAAASLSKGDRIVVVGRLRVRAWENGDRSGITVEVDADAIGHDLHWGRTQFSRITPTRAQGQSQGQEAQDPGSTPAADTATVPAGDTATVPAADTATVPAGAPVGAAAAAPPSEPAWNAGPLVAPPPAPPLERAQSPVAAGPSAASEDAPF